MTQLPVVHLQTTVLSLQQKYRADFEKTKGKMIGLKGLRDDISIAHSVHASKLQSDVGPLPEKQLTFRKKKTICCKQNQLKLAASVSRSSTSRTQPKSCRSSTSPWTWWRWPTPRRPSRWSATRTTGSPCTSTPRCPTTWRCRQPRGRTPCRARWELPPRLEKIASVQNLKLSFSKQSDCLGVKIKYLMLAQVLFTFNSTDWENSISIKTAHFALCLRPAAKSLALMLAAGSL